MSTQINLGAKINVESTGSDRVQSQIDGLERELTNLGSAGDESMKKWLRQMIEVAKVGKEIVGSLEKGVMATRSLNSATAVSNSSRDLTASINRLDNTIANFAVAMQRQTAMAGTSIREQVQSLTGRPQNNAYQEINEIATREQGKQIKGQAIEIVNLLSQAEDELDKKRKDVRDLVKGIKTKINFSKLMEDFTLTASDLGLEGRSNADIINDELLSSLQGKFNVEMLSDVDQMFKVFDVGFDAARKEASDGITLLRNKQGQWLSQTVEGQKLMADLAMKFYRSNSQVLDPKILQLETATNKPDFNLQRDIVEAAGDGAEADNLREMVGLVQRLFTSYEDIDKLKREIYQIDESGNSQASSNMQKLERMLALNRDQLALAKENNAVSVRYNTILQQNEKLMGNSVGAINQALVEGDFAQIAVLQRTYSNQIQKSVNLEKQLQQLIERNANLQQGYMGQLNTSLKEATGNYFKMGTTIRDVTQAAIAQDAARTAGGGSAQFGGFISGTRQALAGLDDLLANTVGGPRLAEKMLGKDFNAVLAGGLRIQIGKAVQMAATDPKLGTELAAAMSAISDRLFEFASAADGSEGISRDNTESLLQMAEALRTSARSAKEASAGVSQYTEGLNRSIQSQEAVRASSASVSLVLERLRSQMRVGDESSRIMERVQRNAQRNAFSTQEVLGEIDTILASLRQPLGLFDRETIANAKSFLTTLQSQARASRENVEALKQAKTMALADNANSAVAAQKGLPSVFEGSSNIEADAKKSADAISQYYDRLILEAQESATQINQAFNRSFNEINRSVRIGQMFNNLQESVGNADIKIAGLTEQYRRLNMVSDKSASGIVAQAQANKQLSQDIASVSREIRKLEGEAQALNVEMSEMRGQKGAPIDQMKLKEASARYSEILSKIKELKKQEESLSKISMSRDFISGQGIASTIDKNRSGADRLIGTDFGDMKSQFDSISKGLKSNDLNTLTQSVNEFKALKSAIQGAANEADTILRRYQSLENRKVQLNQVDRDYIKTLQETKKSTSDLLVEMAKKEGAMKSAETKVKVTTQTFDEYAQSLVLGLKNQIDFAIGAGALTATVGSMGIIFRELISEARMMSRTLTVLQSDILNTAEVSKIAHDRARELSVQYGMTISAVADVAKELGSAGMKLEEVNRAWEDTLRAVNATNAETTQVTRAVAGIYNVYKQELKEAGNEMNEVGVITDTVTSIFQNHQAEMDEIVQGYKFVVGTGKTAGFTFQEMGAFLAVLNDNMIKSGMAGRGLQTVFAQTAAKTDQLAKMFNIKLDPSKTIASQFVSLLEQMNDRIGGVEVSARDMNKIFQIFDREGARAFTTLVQQLPAVKKALHETRTASAGVNAEMNRIINQSLDRKFWQMKQAILNVAREGFDYMQPAMVEFLDGIKGMAVLFKNINSAMDGAIVKTASFTIGLFALANITKVLAAVVYSMTIKSFVALSATIGQIASSAVYAGRSLIWMATTTQASTVAMEALKIKIVGLMGIAKQLLPLLLLGLAVNSIIQTGSVIEKLQNQVNDLKLGLDETTGSITRLSNEFFRLTESEKSINKITKALISGQMAAGNAGRAIRDLVQGLGQEAQLEFTDLSGMSDEDIAGNAMKIEARLTEFRIRQLKKVEEERKKLQDKAFQDQAKILRLQYIKNTSANPLDATSGPGAVLDSAAQDLYEANRLLSQNVLSMEGFGKSISAMGKALGGLTMNANQYLFGDEDTAAALSGQDPAKIKSQREAIAAVLDGESIRQSNINKLREAGLRLVAEERKIIEGTKRPGEHWTESYRRLPIIKKEIEDLQAALAQPITTPEQKRQFDEMIGGFQKWRSQSRLAGASQAEFNNNLRKFLEDMKLTEKEINGIMNRMKELDFASIIVPDIQLRDSFQDIIMEVDNLRSSLNWQGSIAAFDAVSQRSIDARRDIEETSEVFGKYLDQLASGNIGPLDMSGLSEGSMSTMTALMESGVSAVRFRDINTVNQQLADQISNANSIESLNKMLEQAGIEIEVPIGYDPQIDDAKMKDKKDELTKRIKEALDKLTMVTSDEIAKDKDFSIDTIIPVNFRASMQAARAVVSNTDKPAQAAGLMRNMSSMFRSSQENAQIGRTQADINNMIIDGGKGLEQNAFRLAEINSLLKKQNELNGIINKKSQDIRTSSEKIIQLNKMGQLGTSRAIADRLKLAKSDKERLTIMIEINQKLKEQANLIKKKAEEGQELTDEDKKQLEALQETDKALKDAQNNRRDEIAKRREIAIQIEQENNALRNQMQLLGKTLIFIEQGAAASARDVSIAQDGVDAKIRELIVSRQLLGLKKNLTKAEKERYGVELNGIKTINDLYNAATMNQGLMFKSGKESVKGYTELAQLSVQLIEKQRKYADDFANENSLLIETLGVTQTIISGGDDSMFAKANQQIFAMLQRLPQIDLIEQKIMYVRQNSADMIAAGVDQTKVQQDMESQLIQLYAKKAKLLQEMQKAQKELTKQTREQLVDDKRPELYQAAADALQQFQQPLEKETGDRLKSLFDRNAMDTAMGIQSTTGDPLMFILNNREEAMRRFILAAKEGQVDFSRLSSTVQNTLAPQIKAYQEMLHYEAKLKDAYVSRAVKVGVNLSDQIAEGDFSKANTSFATLQQSILDMTRKTGNELLTVKASEMLIKINEEMLDAEKYQQDAMLKKLEKLKLTMAHVGDLFVEEARKIQGALLGIAGANWDDIEAALKGELRVRTDNAEEARQKLMQENNNQLSKLNTVLTLFAQKQGVKTIDILQSSLTGTAGGASEVVGSAMSLAKTQAHAKAMADNAKATEDSSSKLKAFEAEEEALAAKRKESAARITRMTNALTDWANNIKDTRVQAEAYAESLKIIRTDSSKAADTIQQMGEAQRKMWRDGGNTFAAFATILSEEIGPAFAAVNEAAFAFSGLIGNIDYAVENAATYQTLLDSIRQATETYITSVDGATTSLKRNENGYYDYINAIQDAEKARYEQLMEAEKTYRENLKKTEDVFKQNFLNPIKEGVAGLLQGGMSSIQEKASTMLSEGLNQVAFGIAGLSIGTKTPEQQLVDALNANTKSNDEQTAALTGGGMSDAMKEYLKTSPTELLWKQMGSSISGIGAVRSEENLFAGELVSGLAKANAGILAAVVGGAVSAFGGVIGMAFDATMNNQTAHLMKFIERFAAQLPEMITGFVEKFQEFFPSFVNTLVTDVLPAAITALMEALPPMLGTIITTFTENLAPFVTQIVKGLKDLMGPLFKTLINGVFQIVPALMEIVPSLMEILPTLIVEGVAVLIKNLPKIIVGALMVMISFFLAPIEMLMGLVRAVVGFFGGDIGGFSIMKYVAKATKALMDFIPTFHKGGVVPGNGEAPATLLGGEGVLNRRAMSILGKDGLDQLNKGYAPLARAYGPLGAAEMSRMRPSLSKPTERSYGAGSSVKNEIGGISIVVNGNADRRAIEELPDALVNRIDEKLAKKQANRTSKMK